MNNGLVSEWHSKENIDLLLDILQPGDLLEFDRHTYKHWAVFVGWNDEGKSFCIIHRAGITDNGSSCLVFAGSLHSALSPILPEGVLASIGTVRLDSFLDVLGADQVRINNSNDAVWQPLPAEEIVQNAAIGVVQQHPYHTLTNNCEHFANKCRYGHPCSHQVQAVVAGATTVALILAPIVTVGSALAYILFNSRKRKQNE